jgi:hypothetical protein
VAAVSLVGACSDDSKSTGTTATNPAATGPVVTTGDLAADPLEALLITSLPDGFELVPDNVASTGPSDLAKAAHDDGGTDAEAVLTAAGFVHGYQRAWQSSDQKTLIIAFLYQFATADGAVSYRDRTVASLAADTTLAVTEFAVSGIPDAVGSSLKYLTGSVNYAASVLCTNGGYLVYLMVVGGTDPDNRALAAQLAADQYGRL